VCSLEDGESDGRSGGVDPAHGMALVEAALRAEMRPFDQLTRLDELRFGLLLPEPGSDPVAAVRALARHVTERIQRPAGAAPSPGLTLGFGFATNEADEEGAASLEERASHPRILMV